MILKFERGGAETFTVLVHDSERGYGERTIEWRSIERTETAKRLDRWLVRGSA